MRSLKKPRLFSVMALGLLTLAIVSPCFAGIKIAYFGSAYPSHNIAPKQLINRLAKQGHIITYFAPRKYKYLVEKMEATFVPYPEKLGDALNDLVSARLSTQTDVNLKVKSWVDTTANISHDLIPWAEEQLKQQQIDLVLYSNMAIWGYIAAQNLGLPNCCSLPSMTSNTNIMKKLGGSDAIYLNLSPKATESLDVLCNSNKDIRIKSFADIMTGEYNKNKILYTSEYFQDHAAYFATDEYIFFPERCINEAPITKTLPDKLRIFVSFGTIYNNNIQLFKDIIDIIASSNYEIIVSAGGNERTFNALNEYNTHSNVVIKIFVDQEQTLNNTDIFITHAGLNSVSESICHYVPMAAVPLAADQHSIANNLQRLNAGISVSQQNVKSQIAHAINQIVNNWEKHQSSLSTIRASFDNQQAIQSAIDRITGLAREKRDDHDL
jgi:MGT family glycosyltransferase